MLAMVAFLRVDSALEDRLVHGNTFFFLGSGGCFCAGIYGGF